jgi:hypothetical protein
MLCFEILAVQAAATGNQEQVQMTAIQLALDYAGASVERLYRSDDSAETLRAKIEHRKHDRSFFAAHEGGAAQVEEVDKEIALLEKRLAKLVGAGFSPPMAVPSAPAPGELLAAGGQAIGGQAGGSDSSGKNNMMESMREKVGQLFAAEEQRAVRSLQNQQKTYQMLRRCEPCIFITQLTIDNWLNEAQMSQ